MSKKNRKEKLRLEQMQRREIKDKKHRSSGLGKKYKTNYEALYGSLNGEHKRFKSPQENLTMRDYNNLRNYVRSLDQKLF